ncbi:MAG TPA: dihydrodipicolinate synthase family protein [Anaerolineae bacterium]|nr:dihydrodipicolinate synthase family protein [Anaerolineae bacterium]
MTKQFSGIIPPVITCFDEEGRIDEEAQREVVRFQAKHVNGFYPCGTYGSGPLMTIEERKRVAEIVVEEKGSCDVIVHVGAINTGQSVELAEHAQSIGADAVGAIPPYYYKYTSEQLLDHYRAIIRAVDLPVFLYNNPGLSGNPISAEMLATLADEGLAGVKDSAFDLVSFYMYLIKVRKPDFIFIIGTEAIAAAALDAGANGVISGLANVFPEFMASFYRTWQEGNPRKTGEHQLKVVKARSILKYGPTLTMTYAVLKMRGMNPGHPRAPYQDIPASLYERAEGELRNMGLL